MASYSTALKDWGSSGAEFPNGYDYVEGEQPVDAWDNYAMYHVIQDIKHLITVTNARIETGKGASSNKPGSPHHGQLYYDQDNDNLLVWNNTKGTWQTLIAVTGDNYSALSVLDDGVEVADEVAGLDFDSNLTVTDNGDGTFTIDGSGNTDTRTDVSDDGSEVVAHVHDINFGARLGVSDDGDQTVTVRAERVGISDDGSKVLTDVDDINFGDYVTVSADGDGSVTVNGVENTHTNVSDDGTEIVSDVEDINAGARISVVDDGDDSVTLKASHAGVSDAGSTVESNPDTIDFGDKLSVTDNGDGTVTIDTSALDEEETEDAVAALLTAGSNISLNYDDNGNELTISATDTRTDVSEDGTQFQTDVDDINFGTNLNVTDDGDGSVTIEASSGTDTRTDVSDGGGTVETNVEDINFGSDLSVTDDGDGSVTVDGSGTDTRANVSDDGSQVVSDVDDINFGSGVSVSDDGDGSVTVSASGGGGDRQLWGDSTNVPANSKTIIVPEYITSSETLTISEYAFHLVEGTAVPSGVNLVIVSYDGSGGVTIEQTIVSGDGATIYDHETTDVTFSPSSDGNHAIAIENTNSDSEQIATRGLGNIA